MEYIFHGQINGRPSKEEEIRVYMIEYPEVTKQKDIAAALGVNKNTVNKYYHKIREEIAQKNAEDFKAVERLTTETQRKIKEISDLRKRLGMK